MALLNMSTLKTTKSYIKIKKVLGEGTLSPKSPCAKPKIGPA